ncbi:iron-only hydrogenase system regulator [Oscillospiraceae bacterium OttesenSCG-928-G22]|nr:iron-only hydrogenase system regulator [Oscillospiraceae bacterium OttesenSCG-928-G22]
METRIAIIAIIVEKNESTRELNDVLHEYRDFIIGRMGLPYRARGVNIISVAVDAPADAINALSGKVGRIDGVTSKTAYSNVGA